MKTIDQRSLTRRDWLLFGIVLVVAALLRLGAPGLVEFKHDEALLSLRALEFAYGLTFPLTGIQSSVGVPNPPISVYLLSLPLRFTTDPVIVTMVIAAFNVVGVGLLWLLAYRLFGRSVALIAGLAYACNPWAILYSRKIWAQDFHTPLVLLALLLGVIGWRDGRRWAQVLCLPVLLLALQIHFAAWALLPLYGALLWLGWQRDTLKRVVVGGSVLLAALTLVPYAIGLSQTDPNLLRQAVDGGTTLTLDPTAARYTVQLAAGVGLETEIAPDQQAELLTAAPPYTQIWLLLAALTLAGMWLVWRQHREVAPLLIGWALLPLAAFTPTWTDVFPHYFIASLPAFALLTALSVDWLMSHLPGQPLTRTNILTAFLFLLLTQALWWRGALRFVETVPLESGFGRPAAHLLPVRDMLLPADDVLLITHDADLLYSQTPAIWSALLFDPDRCVRAVDDDDLRIFPPGSFVTLVTPDATASLRNQLAHYQHADVTRIDTGGDRTYELYFKTGLRPQPPAVDLASLRFDNGVAFTGYDIDFTEIRLRWRLPGRTVTDYHFFVHLLGDDGDLITQADAPFLQGHFWCDGDTVETVVSLALPPDAVTLRVGLYELTAGGFRNARLVDAAGNPGTFWADVPLLPAAESEDS